MKTIESGYADDPIRQTGWDGQGQTPADCLEEIPVSPERLWGHVQYLTRIDPPRNFHHPQSLAQAADYIAGSLQKTAAIESQVFGAEGREYRNIIAPFGPVTAPRIVVGAHYDVYRNQPGADDNGSGVAALLELASLFSTCRPALKHRIDLVAYGLEEPPYFRTPFMGSAVHARSLAAAGVDVRLMISLDALGFYSVKAVPAQFLFPLLKSGELEPGNTTAVVGRKGQEDGITRTLQGFMAEKSRVKVLALALGPETPGIDFSDHLNYWHQGYPGVMISNFYTSPNPHYHKPGDTTDTLDFPRLSEVVKGLYWALTRF